MANSTLKYYFPLGLIICFVLDGTLSSLYAQYFFTSSLSIESRLTLLWLVMAIFYGEVDRLMLWAFIAGVFFDMYYTGILGIFMIIFPLIVYLNREVYRFFTSNFIVVLLIYLIDVTLVTAVAYWVNSLIGLTTTGSADFVVQTLGPSLAYNLAVFSLLFIPVKNFFEKYSSR